MASKKSAFEKLGIRPDHRAARLALPEAVERSLGALPAGCRLGALGAGEHDFLLGFYESSRALGKDLAKIRRALKKSGMAWVGWRKGGVTDLSRDSLAALVEREAGLEGVSACSIDDDWSALKFMYPKAERGG